MIGSKPFPLPYQVVVSSRSRSIRASIHAGGIIQVRVPHRSVPVSLVEKFLWDHAEWFVKHVEKMKLMEKKKKVTNNSVEIFGKKYRITIQTDGRVKTHIEGDQLLLSPVQTTLASIAKERDRFCKTVAQQYIIPRTKQWAEKMSISYRNITLKLQTSRWGSCSSIGNLNFNWRLVHFNPVVIDYVIIHELAHRQQMNHSAQFWEIVAKFDPAYKQHRAVLKKYGPIE